MPHGAAITLLLHVPHHLGGQHRCRLRFSPSLPPLQQQWQTSHSRHCALDYTFKAAKSTSKRRRRSVARALCSTLGCLSVCGCQIPPLPGLLLLCPENGCQARTADTRVVRGRRSCYTAGTVRCTCTVEYACDARRKNFNGWDPPRLVYIYSSCCSAVHPLSNIGPGFLRDDRRVRSSRLGY